jgi:hypothetical protein
MKLKEKPNTKESEHCLNKTSTSIHHTALLGEENEDQHHEAGHENASKSPPIYITDIKDISSG